MTTGLRRLVDGTMPLGGGRMSLSYALTATSSKPSVWPFDSTTTP